MFTVLDFMEAYGTSEGVSKAWDERGRTGKVLKAHGWKSNNIGTQFTHKIHDRHIIFVNKDGSWDHMQVPISTEADHNIDRGHGATGADLGKHLLNYRWSNKHLGRNVN